MSRLKLDTQQLSEHEERKEFSSSKQKATLLLSRIIHGGAIVPLQPPFAGGTILLSNVN